jgi:hypothetical protein
VERTRERHFNSNARFEGFCSSPVRGSDQDESTFIHAQANITGNGVTDAEDSLPYVQEEHPNKDVTQ